ncbi:MAG TPA: hypothetical protein VEA99_08045 [Gemmatimonadaceae bacterium]|nr:hypothetical protein [Gemmatimonadaceae bacterium]
MRRRALSAIEAVIVLVIVGLLVAITLPRFARRSLVVTSAPPPTVPVGASGELAVRVTDWRARGHAGDLVAFVVEARGVATARVEPARARADSAGVARARWTVGPMPGRVALTARLLRDARVPEAARATVTVEMAVVAASAPPDSARPPTSAPRE